MENKELTQEEFNTLVNNIINAVNDAIPEDVEFSDGINATTDVALVLLHNNLRVLHQKERADYIDKVLGRLFIKKIKIPMLKIPKIDKITILLILAFLIALVLILKFL